MSRNMGTNAAGGWSAHMARAVREGKRRMPATPLGRTATGFALILGGLFSFLPLLGIWMLPVGLVVMSVDWPLVRRLRRKSEVRLFRAWRPAKAG